MPYPYGLLIPVLILWFVSVRMAYELGQTAAATKMPESMDASVLGGMKVGEVAYTMPWAMMADEKHRLFLNARYPAHEGPGGTVSMRVERHEDGYHVYNPDPEGYVSSRGIPWVGARHDGLIPVRAVYA